MLRVVVVEVAWEMNSRILCTVIFNRSHSIHRANCVCCNYLLRLKPHRMHNARHTVYKTGDRLKCIVNMKSMSLSVGRHMVIMLYCFMESFTYLSACDCVFSGLECGSREASIVQMESFFQIIFFIYFGTKKKNQLNVQTRKFELQSIDCLHTYLSKRPLIPIRHYEFTFIRKDRNTESHFIRTEVAWEMNIGTLSTAIYNRSHYMLKTNCVCCNYLLPQKTQSMHNARHAVYKTGDRVSALST